MPVVDYLAAIDWAGGLITAVLAVVIAAAIVWFTLELVDELAVLYPFAQNRFVDALLDRRPGAVPTEPWVCTDCRSINDPIAEWCYHGCQPRADVLERYLAQYADETEAEARRS